MDFAGNIIKKSRISKKISISQVEKELKISKAILEKIENNEIDENINIVYYLGHVRSFANFLDFWTVLLPIISNVEFFAWIIEGIADFLAIEEQPITPNLIFDFILSRIIRNM